MYGMASPPKEPTQKMKPDVKSSEQSKQPTKAKRGSVLSAIEDIQRMSPEAIVQEFDRMVDHTQRHFRDETFIPCLNVADDLIRCLRQHKQQSFMCFHVMQEYQHCVGLATQAFIDRMAEEDERKQREAQQLPVMPPQTVPAPAMTTMATINPPTVEEVRRKRSWLKPWTWLR
ncbi:hypothetical protein KR093_002856 [Drosophila rubida]|uniref:Uncharacterized protein n=1 Tax=Drosophila rubida TaxID=30044 RepID=A0AAD4KCF7_9MUSC|nr:hypothetical protein KR093_002856 [Drosophila rubida]